MSNSSLETKTIRPGSLGAYSRYYHSNRTPANLAPGYIVTSHSKLITGKLKALAVAIVLLVTAVAGLTFIISHQAQQANSAGTSLTPSTATNSSRDAPAAVSTVTNHCAGNNLSQLVLVSIGQRHMWACQGDKTVYDSPVITGINYLAADVTPGGTYQISAKITDTTLTGADSTGSWSDPVSYWMPFLNNQYGSYGFHDATWRPNSAFGAISPSSSNASHGCVELPLATAKWLYNWVQVGTTVTIQS
jgi:lipoprotein-anchoring transpeptidase ErfK/SrfK